MGYGSSSVWRRALEKSSDFIAHPEITMWWAGWDSNPLSVDYESTAYTN
jgi:hypothetical protein